MCSTAQHSTVRGCFVFHHDSERERERERGRKRPHVLVLFGLAEAEPTVRL